MMCTTFKLDNIISIVQDIYRVLRNFIYVCTTFKLDNIISIVQDIYRVLSNSIYDVYKFQIRQHY